MRQIGDLAIWVGMIVLAVGVVYLTPVVAEYAMSEPQPQVVKPIPRPQRDRSAAIHPYAYGERHAAR